MALADDNPETLLGAAVSTIRRLFRDSRRTWDPSTNVSEVVSALEETITQGLRGVATTVESAQGRDNFLMNLYSQWLKYNEDIKKIRNILKGLKRAYVTPQNMKPLHELFFNLWRDHIVRPPNIKGRLLDSLLDLVYRERTGEVINRGLMRNLTQMFSDLGQNVYVKDFERHFLHSTEGFYRLESQQCLKTNNCSEYLRNAERRLNEEVERVIHYGLASRTGPRITAVVEREMIGNHMKLLVEMENSGLVSMLIDDKYDDLASMYNLFRPRDGGLQIMRDVMVNYLREMGSQLVKDRGRLKDPVELVQRLMDEKDKYDTVIRKSFGNDEIFRNALKSSFEYFISLNDRSPEFLSIFLDDKLRKGLNGGSEELVETVLDKIMELFRYLQNKDEFELYHRLHLLKRVLQGRTLSVEGERSVIVKLKTECGPKFTSKLECVYTDVQTSKYTLHHFNMMLSSSEAGEEPTFAVQVLRSPRLKVSDHARCNLPTEIFTTCGKFKDYYQSVHKGRRLTWQHHLGAAELEITLGNGRKYGLHGSMYQMCILLLFNEADSLSYREIEQVTALPPLDLKRHLHTLACVRGKNVLKKEPMSEGINEADVFHFNDEFSSKHSEVEIFTLAGTLVAQKESEPEEHEKLDAGRNPHIEAAIIRIMKSRLVLDHNRLISEVTQEVQRWFLPNTSIIEKRIESLIEREFLERDSTGGKLFGDLKFLR